MLVCRSYSHRFALVMSRRSIRKVKRSLQTLSTNTNPFSNQKCEAAQSLSDKLDAQLEALQAQLDAHLKLTPKGGANLINSAQPNEPVYLDPKAPLVLPNGVVLWPVDDAVAEGCLDQGATDSEDAEVRRQFDPLLRLLLRLLLYGAPVVATDVFFELWLFSCTHATADCRKQKSVRGCNR